MGEGEGVRGGGLRGDVDEEMRDVPWGCMCRRWLDDYGDGDDDIYREERRGMIRVSN